MSSSSFPFSLESIMEPIGLLQSDDHVLFEKISEDIIDVEAISSSSSSSLSFNDGEDQSAPDFIMANDCFLGSTVDIVDENSLCSGEDDDDDEDPGLEFINCFGLSNDDDDDEDHDFVGRGREDGHFLDETLDDCPADDDDRTSSAAARTTRSGGGGDRKKKMMPKFQIRIRPEDGPGAGVGKKRKKDGRGGGKRQKTLVYLDQLPDESKKRRGKRGPYRKRSHKPNIRPKAVRRIHNSNEGDDDSDGLHILEKRSVGRPRLPEGLKKNGSHLREKEKRLKMMKCVELMRKVVPGIGSRVDRASVTLLSAQYILFLKKQIGVEFDNEFVKAHKLWSTWSTTPAENDVSQSN